MAARPSLESPSDHTNSFLKQLGFWTLHCGVTSIPSFCIALTAFNTSAAIIGMLAGILTFILGYTTLTSARFYSKLHLSLVGRSIKLGARIRMWISICSLPLLIAGFGKYDSAQEILFVPDMWFGLVAILIFSMGAQSFGVSPIGRNIENIDAFSVYCITIIEGVLISVSLILIAFVVLIVLNYKRNRQRLPSDFIPK